MSYLFLMSLWVSHMLRSEISSVAEVLLKCGSGEMFWKQLYRSFASPAAQQWKSTCSPFSSRQNLSSSSCHWNTKEDGKWGLKVTKYSRISMITGFLVYLPINTAEYIPLAFAALFESFFYTIDGLGLASHQLIAWTWQTLHIIEGTLLEVLAQGFNNMFSWPSRREVDVNLQGREWFLHLLPFVCPDSIWSHHCPAMHETEEQIKI